MPEASILRVATSQPSHQTLLRIMANYWSCRYYNNTRCFNCAFTSDDQSCLEQCTCRPFPKKIGKKVALPVELPGLEEITDTETTDSANFDTAVTSATSTPTEVVKRDSETELEHVPFFCGTTDLTIECAKVGVVCGSEGIQSDSKVCQKNCVCHNWNSVAPPSILGRPPHHSRNLRRVTSPPVRIVNCGDLELRKDCVDNFSTVCTPEGIASDSSICRERCYC